MTFVDQPDPIVPDMDARIRSTVNKYTRPSDPTFQREWGRATPAARRALRDLDAERLTRGSRALSQPRSAVGLRAASTGESSIGNPDEGIWGDFTRNVGEFVSGLPRLPQALVGEVRDLGTVPDKIPEALAKGDSPLEDLGNLAQLPGLRMVPGAFVASQFGTDMPGVKGLVDNPLWTGLDVLPFASKAAGMTKVAKVAESLAEPGARVGKFSTVAKYGRPVGGPVLDAAGELVPNRLGRAMESSAEHLAGTRAGNAVKSMWGKRAGDFAQQNARIQAEYVDPKIATSADNETLIRMREENARLAADIDPARMPDLTRMAQRGQIDQATFASLPKPEQEFVRHAGRMQDELARQTVDAGDNVELTIDTAGGNTITEVFSAKEGRKILRARKTRDRFTPLSDVAADLKARTPSDPVSFTSRMARTVDAPLSFNERGWLIRSELARLELAGVDVTRLKKAIAKITKADDMVRFHESLGDPALAATLKARPFTPPSRASLQALARTDPLVRSYLDLSDAGAWTKASQTAKKIARRTAVTGGIDWSEVYRYARAESKVEKAIRGADRASFEKLAKRAEAQVSRVEQTTMPARYSALAADEIKSRLGAEVANLQAAGKITAQEAADATAVIALETLDAPSLPPSLKPVVKEVARDVRSSWQQFADAGLDPQFVHRTARSQMGRAPSVLSHRPRLSQVQDRVLDFGSSINDWAVALDAQAAELLSRRASEAFADFTVDSFSKPLDEIKADLAPFAQDIANRKPSLDPQKVLNDLVARNWREIETHRGTFYVPRDVATVFDGFGAKQINSAFMSTYDKLMGVFRTSLLPLSPRWHLYNIVGGAIMVTAEHGPGVWRHWREAWDIARNGGLEQIDNLPAMGKSTRAVREAAQWSRKIDITTKTGKTLALWDMAAGKFLRRVWDESEAVATAQRGGRAVLDRSYAVNEMFDDMYRSMAYLYGEGKAARKGMSVADQQAMGVASARRVLANWDRLTPIERSVIRNIFPFYSWSKHLLGFVSRYPFDHALRTSITASLVRAELEDFGTGLPQSFFSLIDVTGPAEFLGADVADGEKVMLNMDGMNPFRDVASWASLVSFMGSAATGSIDPSADIGAVSAQSSPAIQFLLGAVGVDPAEGIPDPYADVTLDPRTGQLRTVNNFNPVAAIPQSLIPQTRILNDVLGVNRDFQRLVHSNPDAARRRLLSSAGLPAIVSPRTVNVPKETIKAEVRRYEDVLRTRSKALRSGNLDILDRYPSILGPTKARLERARRIGALDIDDDQINAAVGG